MYSGLRQRRDRLGVRGRSPEGDCIVWDTDYPHLDGIEPAKALPEFDANPSPMKRSEKSSGTTRSSSTGKESCCECSRKIRDSIWRRSWKYEEAQHPLHDALDFINNANALVFVDQIHAQDWLANAQIEKKLVLYHSPNVPDTQNILTGFEEFIYRGRDSSALAAVAGKNYLR